MIKFIGFFVLFLSSGAFATDFSLFLSKKCDFSSLGKLIYVYEHISVGNVEIYVSKIDSDFFLKIRAYKGALKDQDTYLQEMVEAFDKENPGCIKKICRDQIILTTVDKETLISIFKKVFNEEVAADILNWQQESFYNR